jgi:hypothetical protein
MMMFNTKYKILVLFSIFGLVFLFSNVQAQKLKTLITNGDNAFAENDFFAASLYYNQALLKDSTDIAMQYKYAEASRLNYDFDIANHWYNKVYNADKQGKLFPECVFWIATITKIKGNYKEAKALFAKYAQKNKNKKNSYFFKKANQEVAACTQAIWLIANPDKSIKIVHLDTMVNSKLSEYAPFQADSVLYFSSLRDNTARDKKNDINYNKVYTAIQHSTSWEKAIELDSVVNKENVHNANTAFNADMTKMYISRCEQKNAQDFVCEIFSSDFKNGRWSSLKKLPSEINMTGYTNTQPAIGFLGNEEVLFFASDRPGGMGKMDIWYSKINTNETYSKPVNAGKKVNSIEDEKTPFYCKPCQELFFSSTWHKGLGGFDIFRSNYDSAGFSEPHNMGVPINSAYNDIYFSINKQGTQSFLSSNRPGSYFEEKESCCNDIYMFKLPIDSAAEADKKKTAALDSTQLAVSQMKLLVPLTLYFHNDEPDNKTLAITTTKNYRTTYEKYSAMRETYKREFSKGVQPKDAERAKEDVDELFEDSIDAGMRNLDEFARLLLKVLKEGETVTITMKGFCSPLASTKYNTNLSKRRISSLKNYFLEYENGVFVPFVNNTNPAHGNIIFVEEEMGELKANAKVSDKYNDIKNSVYSPLAALERKIQIIAISVTSPQKK